jgi:histidinol-phosphate aminotransferase
MNSSLHHSQSAVHGGPDALGAVLFDFSTNANACGPCPQALHAVQAADAAHYPDPAYTQLRAQLAQFHGVEPARVLLAASASEFIFRITAWAAQHGLVDVLLPAHSYGDYARAANALSLQSAAQASTSTLAWACDPSSPLGQSGQDVGTLLASGAVVVLDRAYELLRLQGALNITAQQLEQVWQLWTPNKALGLTGVRAAYVIAPLYAEKQCLQIKALCPSWPVGAHGVAMLSAWVKPEVQRWIADSLVTLRAWKVRQLALCAALGWQCLPSDANFFCVYPKQPLPIEALRARGIKLRDCASFGLPQYFRLSVQPPVAQDALAQAMKELT